jgi:hypothetical protein
MLSFFYLQSVKIKNIMGKRSKNITEELQKFIEKQHLFFVGTAAPTGTVNVSPKGLDSLRVIDEHTIVWRNLTGSGNETAAHLLQSNRMTIMFCDFVDKPKILRLYGQAQIYHRQDEEYHHYIDLFPKCKGSRQIIKMVVDLVQVSCGFAVPIMKYKHDRSQLVDWAENKGDEGIKAYWQEKNTKSLDEFPTGIQV